MKYTVPVPDRAGRCSLTHLLLVTAAAVAVGAGVPRAEAQPASEPAEPPGSYQYLSPRAQDLANMYLSRQGVPQGAQGYDALDVSKRATFEAIVNALYAQGILALVEEVTAIWGKDPQTDDGKHQFRLSVTLAEGAVELLLKHDDYRKDFFGWGHVKKPDGDLAGWWDADCVREKSRRPNLQISWLEKDFTVGDIDIDYRTDSEGHNEAGNSDVRASIEDGDTHFDLHVEEYHLPLDLNPWWEEVR